MGLDMRPMGKPRPGFEKRYVSIFRMIESDNIPEPGLLDRIRGKKSPTKEELLQEWFANQIQSYETIKAPKVGRDKTADAWLQEQYNRLSEKPSWEAFLTNHEGFYVIELAEEHDGVPVYISMNQDRNVFRGQFLQDCTDLIGEELVSEAWESKLAPATLDYGKRLMDKADQIATANELEYLKQQRRPPDSDENSIESKLHIMYPLAKWLIFYGKNGHGYEADY